MSRLNSLSILTKASLDKAKDNTQQINNVITGFINLYSSINDHLAKKAKELEETMTGESQN
ncbi:unnamed protein product [Porites lobata]|uniref:Uncharacterized protein n=1 Tax=Porites lobata TaxID=104759 RepID=A0ABN8RIV8_9CNID|nr:unnamed protein product [Porites lobata]